MDFVSWKDDFDSGTIEWNLQTACYVLGALEFEYHNGNLTEKEYEELYKRVPISKEDLALIYY